jgi:hypothetical protein
MAVRADLLVDCANAILLPVAKWKTMNLDLFLEGVPAEHVLDRLSKADGDEVSSGKLASEESSAALAVNTFGWFIERCDLFPALPGMEPGAKVLCVDIEYCARFPWRGGRHPWLDAIVETGSQLVGIESKRFEPYRDKIECLVLRGLQRRQVGTTHGRVRSHARRTIQRT